MPPTPNVAALLFALDERIKQAEDRLSRLFDPHPNPERPTTA